MSVPPRSPSSPSPNRAPSGSLSPSLAPRRPASLPPRPSRVPRRLDPDAALALLRASQLEAPGAEDALGLTDPRAQLGSIAPVTYDDLRRPSPEPPPAPASQSRRPVLWGAAGGALLLGAAFVGFGFSPDPPQTQASLPPSPGSPPAVEGVKEPAQDPSHAAAEGEPPATEESVSSLRPPRSGERAPERPRVPAPPAAPQPDPQLSPFDTRAAAAALDQQASVASACRTPETPSGMARVRVTFAPSGRATNATVAGLYAGTEVGGCIARALRDARVPAFSGEHVSVTRTLVIQ